MTPRRWDSPQRCTCRCHVDRSVKHVRACCCQHRYKRNCPIALCSRAAAESVSSRAAKEEIAVSEMMTWEGPKEVFDALLAAREERDSLRSLLADVLAARRAHEVLDAVDRLRAVVGSGSAAQPDDGNE